MTVARYRTAPTLGGAGATRRTLSGAILKQVRRHQTPSRGRQNRWIVRDPVASSTYVVVAMAASGRKRSATSDAEPRRDQWPVTWISARLYDEMTTDPDVPDEVPSSWDDVAAKRRRLRGL